MLAYTLKRFLGAIPTLLTLITLAFFLVRLAPGGPFDQEKDVPDAIRANLEAKYHLDEPLWQQYYRYVTDLVQGDFGPSFQYKDFTVTELIWGGFPYSMTLGVLAIILALLVGVSIGMLAALRQNTHTDYTAMGVAMTGISIPSFVIGPLFIALFAIQLGWLPAGGWGGGAWQNLVLPVLVLALPQIAYIARLTRGSLIEVLRSPFVLTARAKGLPLRRVLFGHAFKPMLLPIVSYLGPATAGIITGSVVVEQIFGIPGIGRYFVQGALNRDYTLALGVVVFYGVIIIMFNFLVDLLYAWLDPRVRHEYK